jgi:hypothetical protein
MVFIFTLEKFYYLGPYFYSTWNMHTFQNGFDAPRTDED